MPFHSPALILASAPLSTRWRRTRVLKLGGGLALPIERNGLWREYMRRTAGAFRGHQFRPTGALPRGAEILREPHRFRADAAPADHGLPGEPAAADARSYGGECAL